MRGLATERRIDSAIHRVKTSIRQEFARHPVGVAVGALLGGGMVAATMSLVSGPVGIMAGLVVGTIAGGLAGKVVAGTVDSSPPETVKEPHPGLPPVQATGAAEHNPSANHGRYSMPKAFREQWHHLDESSKDLIKGSELEETQE